MATETAGLTREQLIGQTLMAGFDGYEPSEGIIELIQRRHVGAVILFTRNLRDARQTLALTSTLQRIAREAGHPYPLLIATDQENGLVRRLGADSTELPGNMTLGAIASDTAAADLTYQVARASGRELRALGITMNLAPDADVNNNPANPVIGVRSFGEDPARVARLVAAAVRGYQEAGIIATIKHFPGHGDTATDSHLALPVVPFTRERLAAVELPPFVAGIGAGAGAVMTAHLAVPGITGSYTEPATLSPAILKGLLRERLGYQDVIISDCLEMHAISETVGVARGAMLGLAAGDDLILVSHRYDRQTAALDAVTEALSSGALALDDVERAAARVLRLKARTLSWDTLPTPDNLPTVGAPEHRALAERIYALSTTLVRDEARICPLRLEPSQRLLLLGPARMVVSQAVDVPYDAADFVASVRARHLNVLGMTMPGEPSDAALEPLAQAAQAADAVVAVTINASLDPAQTAVMRMLVDSGRPVAGIAAGNPYDLLAFPTLRTYLATYEYTPSALEAAVRVLFGEAPAVGHLPVTLPIAPAM